MNSSSGGDTITPTNRYLGIENDAKLDRMNRFKEANEFKEGNAKNTLQICYQKFPFFVVLIKKPNGFYPLFEGKNRCCRALI